MRINKYVALSTGMSRRAADALVAQGRVRVDGKPGLTGQEITEVNKVTLEGQALQAPARTRTIMLNKPTGYVVSRDGQGSKTIYDLLPDELHGLKPVGRLDKDSSGLLLLTNDGTLANELTHPSHRKEKIYEIELDKSPTADDQKQIRNGVELDDGISRLFMEPMGKDGRAWRIKMSEGRNRQIRRTFAALGYHVKKLHRTNFGKYTLHKLAKGRWTNT